MAVGREEQIECDSSGFMAPLAVSLAWGLIKSNEMKSEDDEREIDCD